jgi:hypothetical protein
VKAGTYPDEIIDGDSFEFSIRVANMILEVEPDTTHFHRGEFLEFTATINNLENTLVQFEIWSAVEMPGGQIISPAYGPVEKSIEPNGTLIEQISQQIPNKAPYGGPYIYTVRIGTYEEEILAEESFEFSIVP